MTKAWEETWSVSGYRIAYPGVIPGRPTEIIDVVDDGTPNAAQRVRLTSAAPEMARVLLEVEWAGRVDYVGDGGYECCASCGGIAPGFENYSDAKDDLAKGETVLGHQKDCALDAALRKAGVR